MAILVNILTTMSLCVFAKVLEWKGYTEASYSKCNNHF